MPHKLPVGILHQDGEHRNVANHQTDAAETAAASVSSEEDNGGSLNVAGSLNVGGSTPIGGSVHIGGALPINNRLAHGPMKLHEMPDSPTDAYHYILNMSPQQHEMKREIAAQLLGSHPSKMWGNLVEDGDRTLKAKPHHYENIVRMPNTHAMARMLEAEHDSGHGDGFWRAVKHVGTIAGKAYRHGRVAAKFIYANKEPLIRALGLEQFRPAIEMMGTAANIADKVVNPIVEYGLKQAEKQPSKTKETLKPLAEKAANIPGVSKQKVIRELQPKGRQ
jgi:hypothetical protein